MPDVKISAGADPGALTATDKVPLARSASTTAYAATVAEIATYANGTYAPPYYTGTPSMDSVGAPGTAASVSRGDHVHPSDTTRVAKAGDTMAGFLTLNANPTANLHAATKQYVDGSAPVGGPYVSIANMHDVGRNLVHNPLFAVAQRGAGPFTSGIGYTLDRWIAYANLDTVSVSQQALAAGGVTGDEGAAKFLQYQFTGNAGAAAESLLIQRIEDVRRLAGKTVTVSVYAVAWAGTPKLGVSLDQVFGTGGSPSASVNGIGQSVTTSAAGPWVRYTLTFTMPSIAGKTIGTSGDSYTGLNIWFSCGATDAARSGNVGVQSGTIQLWGVQLEIGSVATPLEKPDPRYDLANCQRFFCLANIFIATNLGPTLGAVGTGTGLPVQMRAIPSVAYLSGTNVNLSGVAYGGVSTTYVYAQGSVTTANNTSTINVVVTASADL